MTLKQAKARVKAVYPKAVCCSVFDGKTLTWLRVVRSQRNGGALGNLVSVKEVGFDTKAWKSAAENVIVLANLDL